MVVVVVVVLVVVVVVVVVVAGAGSSGRGATAPCHAISISFNHPRRSMRHLWVASVSLPLQEHEVMYLPVSPQHLQLHMRNLPDLCITDIAANPISLNRHTYV